MRDQAYDRKGLGDLEQSLVELQRGLGVPWEKIAMPSLHLSNPFLYVSAVIFLTCVFLHSYNILLGLAICCKAIVWVRLKH